MYSKSWDSTPPRSGSPFSLTPWVRRIIIANAIVFLLTKTVFTGRWFVELFAFWPSTAFAQPWTFVTYMFLHGGFLHLAFNMLILFFFGTAVEERMGSAAFARCYFFSGLGGSVLSMALVSVWPFDFMVGASAAVFGIALAFAMEWPDAEVFVFPLPMPIRAKWLVIGMATIALASAMLRTNDGVAHLAHLGGFLFGFLYLRVLPRVRDHTIMVSREKTDTRVLVHSSAQEAANAERTEHLPRHERQLTLEDVDRVLEKISATGMDSLTAAERTLLEERSEELRNP
jgi:rhomboid family protein